MPTACKELGHFKWRRSGEGQSLPGRLPVNGAAYLIVDGFLDHALRNLALVGIPKDHDLGHHRLRLPIGGHLWLGQHWARPKGSIQLILLLEDLHAKHQFWLFSVQHALSFYGYLHDEHSRTFCPLMLYKACRQQLVYSEDHAYHVGQGRADRAALHTCTRALDFRSISLILSPPGPTTSFTFFKGTSSTMSGSGSSSDSNISVSLGSFFPSCVQQQDTSHTRRQALIEQKHKVHGNSMRFVVTNLTCPALLHCKQQQPFCLHDMRRD